MRLADVGISGVSWNREYFPQYEATLALIKKRSEEEALGWLSSFWLFSNAQSLLTELAPILTATEAELADLEATEQSCIAESHSQYEEYERVSHESQDKRRPLPEQKKLELAKQKANAGWRNARSRGEEAHSKQTEVRRRLARQKRVAEMLRAIPAPDPGGLLGLAEVLEQAKKTG